MTHPNYPDWQITKRLLVDGYPLLLLERDTKKIVLSEGVYKLIIEFLLNVSKPHTSSFDDVNSIMHHGFISGTGWAISGVFYGHLIQPSEFKDYISDPEFNAELEQYQQRTGQVLNEPIWHVSINSGDWRHAKQFIPQSSVQKIIELETQLVSARKRVRLPEGVQVLSEDEWDLLFGWAAVTGLRPSQLGRLERYAARYLEKLETKSVNIGAVRFVLLRALDHASLLNREFETDGVYYQLKESGCHSLKLCLDNAEYLYGYINSQVRLKSDLPIVEDIRDSSISLDWMFQTTDSSLSHVLTYGFLVEAEAFLSAAKPKNLEPLDFEDLLLFLIEDNGQIKLSHVQRSSEATP
ncbi:MAG: hypothetical protein RLZZ156_432 [Deinococcota bacterium]|jgi:hypothetical protein